ncbi:hypothetical protein NT6N_25900 [Oceaniferula spumae]|uniref:Uncharacterized protein n=1 Tax=Oceaniferula spumae TaxID=2979115 RepID=A0AAT9FNM1_9BACT
MQLANRVRSYLDPTLTHLLSTKKATPADGGGELKNIILKSDGGVKA